MAYQPHTLITFGGNLIEQATDDEIWQCGIRGFFEGGGPVPAGDLDELALHILRGPTEAGGGLEGIFDDAAGCISNQASLLWCKAANIGPDGSYTDEPGYAQMSAVHGAAPQTVPSFLTVAISWTTGKTLGKAVRGRIYPPNNGALALSGAKVNATSQSGILNWGKDVLNCVDTSLDTVVFHPYVVSSSGVSNPITGVRVGNVWDTQRRRKNAVPETYVSSGWVA